MVLTESYRAHTGANAGIMSIISQKTHGFSVYVCARRRAQGDWATRTSSPTNNWKLIVHWNEWNVKTQGRNWNVESPGPTGEGEVGRGGGLCFCLFVYFWCAVYFHECELGCANLMNSVGGVLSFIKTILRKHHPLKEWWRLKSILWLVLT